MEFDETSKKLHYLYRQFAPFPKDYSFDIIFEEVKDNRNVYEQLAILSQKYEEKVGTTIKCVFAEDENSNWSFSDNNKMVTRIGSNTWLGVKMIPKFLSSGRQRFSIRIVNNQNKYIMIGVALCNTDPTNGYYSKTTGWMYYNMTGGLYNGGGQTAYFSRFPIEVNDMITTVMDMDSLILSFEMNGINFGPAYRLPLKPSERANLCPAVDLYHIGDSVAVIWP